MRAEAEAGNGPGGIWPYKPGRAGRPPPGRGHPARVALAKTAPLAGRRPGCDEA
jgi:hypothetical protein